MLTDAKITEYGNELFDCMEKRSVVQPLTEREPEITIEDGYRISQQFLRRRLEINNEAVVGKKIGVTSDAVQSMLVSCPPPDGQVANHSA